MVNPNKPLYIESTRGGYRETIHEVHAVLCDTNGDILAHYGDPSLATFERSVAKPIQLMTMIQARPPLLDECNYKEIAVMASSHSGEPGHVETIKGLLEKYGISEDLFLCGTHPAVITEIGYEYTRNGIPPLPIHHNCSGKHTSMLLACQHNGWQYELYNRIDHPVQVAIFKNMGKYADMEPDLLKHGPDGCGVPSFWLDLRSIALTSARFADPDFGDDFEIRIREKIFDAYHQASWWTAGSDRIDFEMNRESDGKWLGKGGGEAVFGVSFRDRGLGLVLKVIDGKYEAVPVALLYIMREWDLITSEQLERLSRWIEVKRYNSPGWDIGVFRIV